MIVLGITGSVGMGKSTVAKMFAAEGAAVCNADALVHELLQSDAELKTEIAMRWPDAVVNGDVNRSLLGKAVFGDDAAMKTLEELIHPKVIDREENFIVDSAMRGKWLVVLDIPLLYETGGDARMDRVAVVTAPESVQRERVLAREGMTEEKFRQILARQMPDAEKRAQADFVIETGEGLDVTSKQVKKIVAALRAIDEEEDDDA